MKLLPDDAGNAMASVAAAGYTVRFREGREPAFDYVNKVSDFFYKDTIPVIKETKKNTLEIDLKPGIFKFIANDDKSLYMLLDASSSGNIKPSQVMEAFGAEYGETLPDKAYTVTREETYTDIAKKGRRRKLVPLDDIGTTIESVS